MFFVSLVDEYWRMERYNFIELIKGSVNINFIVFLGIKFNFLVRVGLLKIFF